MSPMNPSELLGGALEYLQTIGHWIRGQYFDHRGRCCIVGALHHVAYEGNVIATARLDAEQSKRWAYRCLEDAISPGAPHDVDVEAWNDAPERSIVDVLAVIKKAKELAIERGM